MTEFEKKFCLYMLDCKNCGQLDRTLDKACTLCSLYRNGVKVDCEFCKINVMHELRTKDFEEYPDGMLESDIL